MGGSRNISAFFVKDMNQRSVCFMTENSGPGSRPAANTSGPQSACHPQRFATARPVAAADKNTAGKDGHSDE